MYEKISRLFERLIALCCISRSASVLDRKYVCIAYGYLQMLYSARISSKFDLKASICSIILIHQLHVWCIAEKRELKISSFLSYT